MKSHPKHTQNHHCSSISIENQTKRVAVDKGCVRHGGISLFPSKHLRSEQKSWVIGIQYCQKAKQLKHNYISDNKRLQSTTNV